MPLHNYQGIAHDAAIKCLVETDYNPLIVAPTGVGKSWIIAGLCKTILQQFGGRVLVTAHVKELLTQNSKTLVDYWDNAHYGIYSSGLKQKSSEEPIIFGGMASLRNKASELGHRDVMIIDEAHLLSQKDGSSYQMIIADLKKINPHCRFIGLSATPYRTKEGLLLNQSGIFNHTAVDMTSIAWFSWFIEQGYMAKLVTRPTKNIIDVSSCGFQGGDFKKAELEAISGDDKKLHQCIEEMCISAADRNHWIIFAAGNKNSDKIAEILNYFGVSSASVHSGMSTGERDARLSDYKQGKFTALVNNNICTTGFDHKPIDFIGMLRATMSPVRWVQMLGRGTRPSPETGKENCLVSDFVGNARRLGPINDPHIPTMRKGGGTGEAPVKLCLECGTYNHATSRECDYCGNEFTFQSKLQNNAYDGELIRLNEPVLESYKVKAVNYYRHDKKDSPPMIKVQYQVDNGLQVFDEYLGMEHEGYKCKWSRDWWRARFPSSHVPDTTNEALHLLSMMKLSNNLRTPNSIVVHVNKKYPEIKQYIY